MKKALLLTSLAWWLIPCTQLPTAATSRPLTGPAGSAAGPKTHLRAGGTGSTVIDGDAQIKIRFVSCTASKATNKAVFTFLVVNSAAQTTLEIISGPGQTPCHFQGAQGQSFPAAEVPTGDESVIRNAVTVATNVPLQCSILLADVPHSATRLNTIALTFSRSTPGANKHADFQRTLALRRLGRVKPSEPVQTAKSFRTTLEDLPITWTL